MWTALRACLLGALLARATTADDPKLPTDEECLAFGRALQEDVAAGRLDAMIARYDWDAFLDRVTTGVGAEDQFVRVYRSDFKKLQRQPDQMVTAIVDVVRQGGRYSLLRVHEKEGGKRVLFRLLPPNGGVNYHDCMLARGQDGRVRIFDMYVFLSAENLSATLRRTFVPAAATESKGLLEKLSTYESDLVRHASDLERMASYASQGRPGESLRICRALPASLQKDKGVLLLRLGAARAVGDEEYDAAFRDLRLCCPDDPCIDMFAIDAHLARKQYDEALAAVGRVDQAVGGDPSLDMIRSNISYVAGDRAASARLANKAIAAEPMFEGAYWTLVKISLDERKFDETARLLIRIEKTFRKKFGDLKGVAAYQEFVQSAEYRQWLKRTK